MQHNPERRRMPGKKTLLDGRGTKLLVAVMTASAMIGASGALARLHAPWCMQPTSPHAIRVTEECKASLSLEVARDLKETANLPFFAGVCPDADEEVFDCHNKEVQLRTTVERVGLAPGADSVCQILITPCTESFHAVEMVPSKDNPSLFAVPGVAALLSNGPTGEGPCTISACQGLAFTPILNQWSRKLLSYDAEGYAYDRRSGEATFKVRLMEEDGDENPDTLLLIVDIPNGVTGEITECPMIYKSTRPLGK